MSINISNKGGGTEAALQQFAELIISRMQEMQQSGREWRKEWLSHSYNDLPRNIGGRAYSASNAFFLSLLSQARGWKAPLFMTFNQAHEYGAMVQKGEKAWPVIYWNLSIKDENGRKVDGATFDNMSQADKAKCKVVPFLKYFSVFNVDQTNLAEVKPELYASILERYTPKIATDTNGMYVNEALDRMVEKQEWVCPIFPKPQDSAFYRPSSDVVMIPSKEQFKKGTDAESIYLDGQAYYSTMLHEMAHSTGHESRLNRLEKTKFGDEKYAKEELVAELTSALTGQTMGFSTVIADNNAAYLGSWISAMREEPKFIVSVMADVDKASKMVFENIDKQRLALGLEPYRQESKAFEQSPVAEAAEVSAVYRGMDGKLSVHVPGMRDRHLTNDEALLWAKFPSEKERDGLLKQFTEASLETGERIMPRSRERSMAMSF